MSADFFSFPEGCTPRRGRLMASGIVLGLMGCAFGLLGAFYLVFFPTMMGTMAAIGTPPAVPPGSPVPASPPPAVSSEFPMAAMSDMMMLAGAMFSAVALVFLVVAYGSIFLKRWSRPLALYLSVVWLWGGVIYLLTILFSSGPMREMMNEQMAQAGPGGPSGAGIFAIVMAVLVVFLFLFGILLPGLILWLNWHRDVRITLEFCDSKPRWTDACPVPVLGISFGAITLAFGFCNAFLFPFFPIFGTLLTGTAARLLASVLILVLLVVAWGVYRRHILAWVVCLLVPVLLGISALFSTSTETYRMIYEKMGMTEEMIEESLRSAEIFTDLKLMIPVMLLAFLPVIAYLIWSLRFFVSKPTATVP